jgi:hypothetical protein
MYRQKAVEAEQLAAKTLDQDARQSLLTIAASYRLLARLRKRLPPLE